MEQIFNVRVYGVLMSNQRQVLLVEESFAGKQLTKFPGGGLIFGEGTRDCLIRECKEELDIDIKTGKHIYTTDFYQRSAFHSNQQIISIYYEILFNQPETIVLSNPKAKLKFKWRSLDDLSEDEISMPIDKVVLGLIM